MNNYFEACPVRNLIEIFRAKGWSQKQLAKGLGLAGNIVFLDILLIASKRKHSELWPRALLLKNEILRG